AIHDKDGSVSGVPNSYILLNDGVYDSIATDAQACEIKADWNAAVCKGDVGRLTFGGPGIGAPRAGGGGPCSSGAGCAGAAGAYGAGAAPPAGAAPAAGVAPGTAVAPTAGAATVAGAAPAAGAAPVAGAASSATAVPAPASAAASPGQGPSLLGAPTD